uniref:Uncharacterized protein n=1 Tax=Physcomitrium patens TaxID=3218 RepID=A0A2K1JIX9_PHYPA|nr:hypothetical protein PHYPA_018906 [Physcomitrium patens]
MSGWMGGWMSGWMGGWMSGWMARGFKRSTIPCYSARLNVKIKKSSYLKSL